MQTEISVNCVTLDCALSKYVTGVALHCGYGQIDFGNENQLGFDRK